MHSWCLYVIGFEVKNLQSNWKILKYEMCRMHVILVGEKGCRFS